MIVSSFRSEYGVSIYSEEFRKMTWSEFSSLLSGLGHDTLLVRTVQIRLEDDKDVLERFTSAQHRVRNKWRSRNVKNITPDNMNDVLAQLQAAFASM